MPAIGAILLAWLAPVPLVVGESLSKSAMLGNKFPTTFGTEGDRYKSDHVYSWKWEENQLLNFTINVTRMDIEESVSCKADSVAIYDRWLTGVIKWGPVCGKLPDGDFQILWFVDYGLSITFKTDYSYEHEGLTVEISGAPPNEEYVCDLMHDRKKQAITSIITSTNDTIPDGIDCTWDLPVHNFSSFTITVEEMDIEYSGPSCVYDRIEILEKGQTKNVFCGRQSEKTMAVRSKQVSIKFHSDLGENKGRFFITYGEHNDSNTYQTDVHAVSIDSSQPSHPPMILETIGLHWKQIWTFRTHPGFIIELFFWKPIDEAIVIYDGPSRSFGTLTYSQSSKSVNSTAFHVVVEIDPSLSNTWIAPNVTFSAVQDLNDLNTSVAYFGPSNFFVAQRSFNNRLIYVKLLVDDGHYVRPILRKDDTILRESPNTDGCSVTGIMLYDNTVQFPNALGPFCDIVDGYVESVLSKLVGSSNRMYAVMYDYSDKGGRWRFDWIKAIASNCPGYQVTEATFRYQKSWNTKSFNISARLENDINTLSIHTYESYFKCMVIRIVPELNASRAFNAVLTGPLEYRTCHQWNLDEKFYPDYKYESKETCTEMKAAGSRNSTTTQIRAKRAHWSLENAWIELGPVETNICYNAPKCADGMTKAVDVLGWTCGVIRSAEKKCEWNIERPSNDSGYWLLNVDLLLRTDTRGDGTVTITEITPNKKFQMDLTVDYLKLGQLRSFVFRSRHNMDLRIKAKEAVLALRFEYKKDEDSVSSLNNWQEFENFTLFEGNRYRYTLHRGSFSWNDARNSCQTQGGHLVSINTVAELDFLKRKLREWMDFEDFHECLIYIGLSDMQKPDTYRWEDGSPATVTDWYYPFSALDNVIGRTRLEETNLNTFMAEKKMQPVRNNERCVGMVPTNLHFSTNWRKIDCTSPNLAKTRMSICEFTNQTSVEKERLEYAVETAEKLPDLACKESFTLVDNICMAVLTADAPRSVSLQPDRAREMCRRYNGSLAKASHLGRLRLKRYLFSLGFKEELSGFWVGLDSGKDRCITVPILQSEEAYREHMEKSNNTCSLRTNIPSHTICESEPERFVQSCEDFLFKCGNGECVLPDWVCDGQKDCSNGRDEDACHNLGLEIKFTCDNRKKIPISKYCDFQHDCRDDEKDCARPPCSSEEFKCTSGRCISKEFYCDGKSDCADRSDEKLCAGETTCSAFACSHVGCVEERYVNDLQADCPDQSQGDETVDSYPNRTHRSFTYYSRTNSVVHRLMNDCPGTIDQQRCHVDHIQCYPRAEACILHYDKRDKMINCRNGAHLRHCADFQCPGMFKCKRSYCIPRHRVCDGKIDCILGEDEVACEVHTCRNELKCRGSPMCVSSHYICDGVKHCKHGDDEMLCDMKGSICPDNCICLGYSVKCSGQLYEDIPHFPYRSNIRILDFSNNKMQLNNESFANYYQLMSLNLRRSHISYLDPGTFTGASNLKYLDLQENRLEVLRAQTFMGLTKLKTIKLTGNPLTCLEPESFMSLAEIDLLDLSGMKIKNLSDNTFSHLTNLTVLNLSYNAIDFIQANVFSSLKFQVRLDLRGNPMLSTGKEPFLNITVSDIRTDSYRFCCYIRFSTKAGRCQPENDVFSSCSSLLGDEIILISIWFIAILILLANVALLSWFAIWKVPDASSVFALNLTLAHLTFGVSFWIICFVDMNYKGNFLAKDVVWRHSILCKAIGFVSAIGSHKAMYSIVCISVDKAKRLSCTGAQITKRKAWVIDVLGWPLCLLTTLIPLETAGYFDHSYYSRNTLCLPFNFHDIVSPGWQDATAVNVAFIAVSLLIIAAMNMFLSRVGDRYKEYNYEHFDPQLDTIRRCSYLLKTNVNFMGVIMLCNFATLVGSGLSLEVGSTVQVVFLPLAASLNPIIYGLNALQSKRLAKYMTQHR